MKLFQTTIFALAISAPLSVLARSVSFTLQGTEDRTPIDAVDCCDSIQGFCRDGTQGTPCCGYGKCNIFCCNCDGGCRKHVCEGSPQLGLEYPMSPVTTYYENEFAIVDKNANGDISLEEWTEYAVNKVGDTSSDFLNLTVQYYYNFARLGKDGKYHLSRSAAEITPSAPPHAADCCPADFWGYCGDCTRGTPCCGYGQCNVFCCNCDGGCRHKKPASSNLVKTTSDDTCTTTKFAAVDRDGDGIITEYEWSLHASSEILSAGIPYGSDLFSERHKAWMEHFYGFARLIGGEYILTIEDAGKKP